MREQRAPPFAPMPSRRGSIWPVSGKGGASGSGATRSSSRCGLRSLRTRTIDAGSRTPSVSERAPPSHTRSTARSTRRTFAMCCRRCTSRRSSSTAPCRRRRPRRWTRRPGYRARVRCACPAPTRPRSSSRTRSQTRSSASSRARKPHLSPRPCSPPLCSPTSSAQRITPQASATATGGPAVPPPCARSPGARPVPRARA